MTEYNSKNLIFSMDYLDIKEIKVTLTNEEKKRIIDLLCKYKFEDLHLNKTIKGETAIVTSSPFLIYKIVVNKKKLEMDDHILININDKYNDKFIDLWSEIWSIITHKKELENKLPSF